MVAKEKAEKAKEPRVYTIEDLLKMLYTLLNTVGGKAKAASVPTVTLDQMPIDWWDRLAMREIPEAEVSQVYLKPREGDKEKSSLILPPEKELSFPPNFGG